jgi:single-stranded-DNA-specific exonuclease
MKKWKVAAKIKSEKKKDRQEEIVKALLKNRGIKTEKEIQEFLDPKIPTSNFQHLVSQKDLSLAIKRIKKAIDEGESIIIFGDYDCDGICATAILWETLNDLGANVRPFIPERIEGHGLSKRGIEKILNTKPYSLSPVKGRGSQGALRPQPSLIITVDNGISANAAVACASSLGIDIIITDHHLLSRKLPKACAIVHTTELSGAAVAWILAESLVRNSPFRRNLWRSQTFAIRNSQFLDLVAIATIADLVPLVGPSRVLAKVGLEKINQTKNIGLQALISETGLTLGQIGVYEVGWILGPRLNATGRLTSAMDGLRLLCTKDPNRARKLAQRLNELNQKRQKLTEETFNHARKLVINSEGATDIIFVAHKSYHEGIIGLVASRLVEEFHRPAVVVSKRTSYSKGSARSVKTFNIVEAIGAGSHLLEDFGGHPMAAGFTIKSGKLSTFEKKLIQYACEKLDKEKLTPTLKIDCEISLSDITWGLFEKIEKFEPFGLGNPRPCFLTSKFRVTDLKLVGNKKRHLKIKLDDLKTKRIEAAQAEIALSSPTFDGIGFNLGFWGEKLREGDIIDLVYNLDKNVWNGKETLQFKVKDLRRTTA